MMKGPGGGKDEKHDTSPESDVSDSDSSVYPQTIE